MSRTIAIDELRIGMYIHLDGGWLSHPFPLSSFRIATQEQLDTLRMLGLAQVRWCPERSEAQDANDAALTASAASTGRSTREEALRHHRDALSAQREVQQQCERQFGEAAQVWHGASELLATDPAGARRVTEGMAQSMLDKMAAWGEIGIRLVNGVAGDRAAAHALNVAIVSMLIGRTYGLPPEEMLDVAVGALLHDVGKLGLPERSRQPEPGCTSADLSAYRQHVARGVAAGRRMGLSDGALTVIAQHHEHVDGSGYPQRIAGERLAVASRIVAIVNRYDNLCNPSTRLPALTPHEAVATMFAQSRSQFDAAVLNSFIRMMGVYPAGSLVQLTDDRYAMVVGVNSSRPLKPRVLVHDPKVPRHDALLVDLDEFPDVGIRRSLTASRLPPDALDYLDPRPRVSYYFEPLEQPALAEQQAA